MKCSTTWSTTSAEEGLDIYRAVGEEIPENGVVVNKLAPPLPKPDDPAHKNFKMPSVEEIEGMKEEILGDTDPEWHAKYGEASWEVAMVLLGIEPSNPASGEEDD